MKLHSVILVFLLLFMLTIPSCDGGDARSIWADIVKKCATSDLLGSDVLYFGPSNDIGPGSIWRKNTDGGYNVRWLLSNVSTDDTSLVHSGQTFTCSGQVTSSSKISPSATLESSVSPLTGSVAADFDKAKKVTVTINSVQWAELVEGPYETKVGSLDASNAVKMDLGTGNRFVIERALKINGMTADLEFSHDDGLNLKSKYSGPIGSLGTGKVGAGLSADWKGDTTLHLVSTADFYIAGQLSPWSSMGLSSAGRKALGPKVQKVSSAKVGLDNTIQ